MYSCDHSNAPRLWDSGPQILGIFLASSVEVAMVGTHGDRGVASASFSECVDTSHCVLPARRPACNGEMAAYDSGERVAHSRQIPLDPGAGSLLS